MPLRRRASIPAASAGPTSASPIAAGGMSAEACSRPRTAGAKSGVLMAAGGMAAVPSPATAVLMLPLLRLRWRLVPVLLVP